MRLPCKVAQDLLPIYYDGVCSEESAELVEKHLNECPQCSKMLSDLATDMHISPNSVDDIRPLKRITKKWQRSNIRKGFCIALAALLLVTAVLIGIWYFSYAKYFYRMVQTMDRTSEADQFISSSEYTANRYGMRFDVYMPIILSNSGFARVMGENDLVMFLYPEIGGKYSFWMMITDESGESWSVHLNSDLTPNFKDYQFPVRSDFEKAHISQLLLNQKDDIIAMIDAVYVFWDIDLV